MKFLKINELAKHSGVTVRALHHYDQIGLLQPSRAAESDHRLYNHQDVERLQQIISLQKLGFALEEIGQCLSQNENDKSNKNDKNEYDFQKTMILQLEAIETKIENLKKTHQMLRLMLDRLNQNQKITTKELLSFIKGVIDMESLYTPEQLKKIKERYEKYPEGVKEVEQSWPILFRKFEEAMNKGLSPSDPSVQALAKIAQEYIDLFTGGDKEIEASLDKNYTQHKDSALKTWGVEEKVFEYATLARKNYLAGK